MKTESRTVIIDYRLYKNKGVVSRKIVNSDNKDDEEVIRLLRPASNILNKVWEIADKQETCLTLREMMYLKMAKDFVHSICIAEWRKGL